MEFYEIYHTEEHRIKERDYRFANSEEQSRQINKFLCISTAILNGILEVSHKMDKYIFKV